MPADGTLAAITPAEISAALPRQRQLTKDYTPPQQTQVRGRSKAKPAFARARLEQEPPLAWHKRASKWQGPDILSERVCSSLDRRISVRRERVAQLGRFLSQPQNLGRTHRAPLFYWSVHPYRRMK